MPKLGTEEYIEFLGAIAGTFPKEELCEFETEIGSVKTMALQYNMANDRLRKFYELRQTLVMFKNATTKALAGMPKSGTPSAKIPFVRELKNIWEQGTGKSAGRSGDGRWKDPRSRFGKFVKLCVQMMPRTDEFERDFGGLISRAVGAKPL